MPCKYTVTMFIAVAEFLWSSAIKQVLKSIKGVEFKFFNCNFTFNTANYYLSTLLSVILRLFIKNRSHGWGASCIWKINLCGFKKWSSTTLKTFNNYTIIITNNSDKKKNIKICFCLSCLFLSWFSRLLWWISCCFQTFSKSWKSHFEHVKRKIA